MRAGLPVPSIQPERQSAEMGMLPPSPLAMTRISGTTPAWSMAKNLPGAAKTGLHFVGDE